MACNCDSLSFPTVSNKGKSYIKKPFSKHEVSGKKSNYSNTPPSTEDMTDEIICHTQSECTQRFRPEVS